VAEQATCWTAVNTANTCSEVATAKSLKTKIEFCASFEGSFWCEVEVERLVGTRWEVGKKIGIEGGKVRGED
jgi:hypothetical protein